MYDANQGPDSASGQGASGAGKGGSRVKRCTFTLPEGDEDLIRQVQDLANRMGLWTPTRSEVVRAALKNLGWANERKFREAFEALERIPTGRPPSGSGNRGDG